MRDIEFGMKISEGVGIILIEAYQTGTEPFNYTITEYKHVDENDTMVNGAKCD